MRSPHDTSVVDTAASNSVSHRRGGEIHRSIRRLRRSGKRQPSIPPMHAFETVQATNSSGNNRVGATASDDSLTGGEPDGSRRRPSDELGPDKHGPMPTASDDSSRSPTDRETRGPCRSPPQSRERFCRPVAGPGVGPTPNASNNERLGRWRLAVRDRPATRRMTRQALRGMPRIDRQWRPRHRGRNPRHHERSCRVGNCRAQSRHSQRSLARGGIDRQQRVRAMVTT